MFEKDLLNELKKEFDLDDEFLLLSIFTFLIKVKMDEDTYKLLEAYPKLNEENIERIIEKIKDILI